MYNETLRIENLSVQYKNSTGMALSNIHLSLRKGERIGIIGESGCGKTTLALACMGLLNRNAHISGSIRIKTTELTESRETVLNALRWNTISLIFQNSLDVLNPVMTIEEQIDECISRRPDDKKEYLHRSAEELLILTGLSPDTALLYPHQLSGGMRQKVLIAMALSCNPGIIIADEPTSSLDKQSSNEILRLLLDTSKKHSISLIIISHDIDTIKTLCDSVAVLYNGSILEIGKTDNILKTPRHPYTRGLLNSSPSLFPFKDLWGIPGGNEFSDATEQKGCHFYNRCFQKLPECKNTRPRLTTCGNSAVACNRGGITTLLDCLSISKSFESSDSTKPVLSSYSLTIRSGEIAALTGKSGCGKSTLAQIIVNVLQADSGEIIFNGTTVRDNAHTQCKHGCQLIFQDPYSSINEHFTILEAVREPLDIIKQGTYHERLAICKEYLAHVRLPSDDLFLKRKCHSLSGGMLQRIAIARALVMEPSLLIADEICSMLDVSTQAEILRLLKGLQYSKGFSMLYITHDLDCARKIADIIFTMNDLPIDQKKYTHSKSGYGY